MKPILRPASATGELGQSFSDHPALKDIIVLGKMGRRLQRAPERKAEDKSNAITVMEG